MTTKMRTKNLKNYTLTNTGEISVLITVNKGKSYYYPYEDIKEYLEVSADIDREKLSIQKYRGIEQIHYRLLLHENDSLANWQNRERTINLVGEKALIEGEKQVKRNMRLIKKQILEGRNNPIWLILKPIADNKIIHYKTDFYYHEALLLHTIKPNKFLWFVRNTGTWLIYHKHNFNDEIIKEEEKRFKFNQNTQNDLYYWNGSKLEQIDIVKVRSIYNSMPILSDK